jgi:hypothetical protein
MHLKTCLIDIRIAVSVRLNKAFENPIFAGWNLELFS